MTSIKVTVPDRMKAWVQAQTGDGGHASSSAYVRHLIRKDQTLRAHQLAAKNPVSGSVDGTTTETSITGASLAAPSSPPVKDTTP